MTIKIPNSSQTAGIPAQWSDNIVADDIALVTGDTPSIVTEDLVFAPNSDIPALTPVGFNSDGNLTTAVTGSADPEDDIKPVGITVVAVKTGPTPARGAPIYRAGVFNPLALNWPTSFGTETSKLTAFHGSPTPTNIIMRRPKTATV